MAVDHELELEAIMRDPDRRDLLEQAQRDLADPRIRELLYEGAVRVHARNPRPGMTPDEFRERLDTFAE